jgi:hypothetical protein
MLSNLKAFFIAILGACACEPGRPRGLQAGPGAVKGEPTGGNCTEQFIKLHA